MHPVMGVGGVSSDIEPHMVNIPVMCMRSFF